MIPFLHGVLATNGGVASDFELIETQTVGAGGAASVTFSSIPSTYKHLQIRSSVHNSTNTDQTWALIQMNSDATYTNYHVHWLSGDGSSASSWDRQSAAYTGTPCAFIDGNTNVFGVGITDILDYTSTSKNKTIRALVGTDANGSGQVALSSGLWLSTAAVSSLKIVAYSNAYSLGQYSTFSLYGVK